MVKSILIIEDDPDLREYLSDIFSSYIENIFIMTANDGAEGLKMIQRYRPAVVITDIHMPNMNGLDMIEQLRRDGNEIPIIVLSGQLDNIQIIEVQEKTHSVHAKPCQFPDLISSIKAILYPSREEEQITEAS